MVALMPDDKKSANMILETVKRIINESDIKKYSPTSIDQSIDLSALDEKEADKIIEKLVKENERRFK
jgi:hypothetical protein